MFIGLYLYLLLGVVFGCLIDRKEMEEKIPYETFPSAIPLSTIRVGVYIVCSIIWLPAILIGLLESTQEEE